MLTYILAGVALSMDAFAISVSAGICVADLKPRYAVRTAFAFGFAQFLMPLIGFLAGSAFARFINDWDHWAVFGILGLVGGKMLWEALKKEDPNACDDDEPKKTILDLKTLIAMAIATSIDALAVGVSYSLIDAPIWLAASIIGVITFGLCLVGCEFGKRLGTKFGKGAEVVGGLALIGIGTKILLEHILA